MSVHEVVQEHVVQIGVIVHLVHQVLNLLVRHALAEHLPQRVPPFLPLTRTERLVLLRLSLLERRPVQRHVLTEPVPPALVHDVKDNLVTEPAQLAPGLPRAQHHRDNRLPEPGGEPRVARRLGVPQQPPHAVRDAADEEPIGPQSLAAPRRPVSVEQNTTSVISNRPHVLVNEKNLSPLSERPGAQVRHRGPDDHPPVVHHTLRAVPLVVVHQAAIAREFAVDVEARFFTSFQPDGFVQGHLFKRKYRPVILIAHTKIKIINKRTSTNSSKDGPCSRS